MMNRILVILALIAATIVYTVYQNKSLEAQLVSEDKKEAVLAKMPNAKFDTLESTEFKILEQSGSLHIVHFWGTWCAPCEAELPELLSFIKRFESQPDVKFYLVAVNDEIPLVKKHLKTLGIPKSSIIWLVDNNNVYRNLFGTTRVPETWVFSSDKTTLRKYVGPQEWNKTMFFQSFDEYLQISTRKL